MNDKNYITQLEVGNTTKNCLIKNQESYKNITDVFSQFTEVYFLKDTYNII